jgi:hypothetical protein
MEGSWQSVAQRTTNLYESEQSASEVGKVHNEHFFLDLSID